VVRWKGEAEDKLQPGLVDAALVDRLGIFSAEANEILRGDDHPGQARGTFNSCR